VAGGIACRPLMTCDVSYGAPGGDRGPCSAAFWCGSGPPGVAGRKDPRLRGSGVCGGSRGGGRVTATSHSLKLSVCKFIRQWNVWGNYLAMKDLAVRAIVSMSCSRVTHTYRPKRAPRKL
jgi:hypothetical protein